MEVGHKLLVILAMVAGLLALTGGEAGAAPGPDGTRSALIIGVSKHAKTKPVGTVGGAGDAAAVREALRQAGWRDDQMRVLIDGDATAARIREGISWLQSRGNDSSYSIFHYSGHTFQRPGDLDKDGEVLDEFLVPYDANNIIADRELSERLRQVPGWMWANIAGCEAAGFDEGGLSGPRRLVTTSSAEPEKSYEQPAWKMSVFVGLMIDHGMLKKMGDADRNGTVTIQEAFAYAAREAPIMTSKQKKGPQHPQMAGGDGQVWSLAPPRPTAAPPGNASPAPKGLCLPILCRG